MSDETGVRAPRRRRHSPEFKAHVVAACRPHGYRRKTVLVGRSLQFNTALLCKFDAGCCKVIDTSR